MASIATDNPGAVVLLMGNEAIARGAIEVGIGVAAAYPGSPTSEILPTLAGVAEERDIHVEWSANEKVATEVAAAASLAGIRSLAVMKQNGLNIAADFIVNLNMTGSGDGGMVIFVADDPGGMTSSNEQDSRTVAKWLDNPLLEAQSAQEAKEMLKWAYELSERLKLPVFLRGVTRLCYTRGNVALGELPPPRQKKAYFPDTWDMYNPTKSKFAAGPSLVAHRDLHGKLAEAREIFEESPFNRYSGPENPELLIIASGVCTSYSAEALNVLNIEKRVGLLKLGTVWPLPEKLAAKWLSSTRKVLFVEETDPFIEQSVMEFAASRLPEMGGIAFYGKRSGHLAPCNEQSTDLVIAALTDILGLPPQLGDPDYQKNAEEAMKLVPNRPINMCAGCPHRATFWAVKNAIALDGRNGFVCGDIGCYSMSFAAPGFYQARTMHAMGSGTGLANGFGNMQRFGFTQPVLAVSGDSTFYHAVLPALVSGVYNKANFTLLILDNSATAMTGFQPHPGTGLLATGETAPVVDMEGLCRAVGAEVMVCDPFALGEATMAILEMMKKEAGGPRVIIMRHMCQLLKAKRKIPDKYHMRVDQEQCRGDSCGCDRLCTRIFGCPGLMWDSGARKAVIDEAICVGCGLCADVCPAGAIKKEEVN
ncbi:MAG: thiamine pyrophosphate-dependent enzyme [Syntrophales bacterium]